MVLFATACNENEFKRASNTEEFLQAPSNQVDILWVIDNSTSMINEQEAVALGAEDFIANLARLLGIPATRIKVVDVQPAGGRAMAWRDFVRGRPQVVGQRLAPRA
jgi:hypothetical protein